MSDPRQIPAGWYSDPSGVHQFRYFDTVWTEHVSGNGVLSQPPLAPQAPTPAMPAGAGQGYPSAQPAPSAYGPAPLPREPAQPEWQATSAPAGWLYHQPPPAKAPAVAWLVPLAAGLALVGALTPWFRPTLTLSTSIATQHVNGEHIFAWDDAWIGLLGSVMLVVVGIGVIGPLTGRRALVGGRSVEPMRSAARSMIIAGAVSAACLLAAWFLLPSQYRVDDGTGTGHKISWDDAISRAKDLGVDAKIGHGPQIGFWLTAAAAALAVVTGLVLLSSHKSATSPPAPHLTPRPDQPQTI